MRDTAQAAVAVTLNENRTGPDLMVGARCSLLVGAA
jgi:hypothetical protein